MTTNRKVYKVQKHTIYMANEVDSKLEKAHSIALDNLRQCYSPMGIMAGKHHYTDVWARDSCQASLGAIRAENADKEQVKKNLETLANYQRQDGMIPLRVGAGSLLLKSISIKGITPEGFNHKLDNAYAKLIGRKTEARYDVSKDKPFVKTEPVDPSPWFVITSNDYVQQTGNGQFARDHYKKLEKAIEWTASQDKDNDHLIEEGIYAGWADSAKKKGKVLYSNVLYAKAMQSMAELSDVVGEKNNKIIFEDKSKKIKDRINEKFWNGKHYIDWIDSERHEHMPTYDNSMAVIFDIADNSQANSIENEINKVFGEKMHFNPHSENLEKKNISPLLSAIGLSDYHNMSWLPIGCLDAVAKNKIGRKQEATKILGAVADKILKHNNVYEVYDEQSNPINRTFYQSEGPFAWAAGLYIYAHEHMKK